MKNATSTSTHVLTANDYLDSQENREETL